MDPMKTIAVTNMRSLLGASIERVSQEAIDGSLQIVPLPLGSFSMHWFHVSFNDPV